MRNSLLIFILLVLVFPVSVSGQDKSISNITSDITTTPKMAEPQGNIFSDLIDRLQNRQIYEEMDKVNKSMMPSVVFIEDEAPPKAGKSNVQGETTIKTQAAKANSDTIQKVAGQYVLGTGINTPHEVSKVNSNIFDWFGDLLKSITGIFDKGNEEAAKYVNLRTPVVIQKDIIGQKEENLKPTPGAKINAEEGLQTNEAGSFANSDSSTNMEKSLSISRCSVLPFGICNENELILEKLK